MHKAYSRLVATGVVTALAVLAIGAPGSAGGGSGTATLAIVNGVPAKKIDICLNGKEVRSGLRYGAKRIVNRAPGNYKLKIFKRDARKCKGVKLMQRKITLAEHADLTLVATRKAPKLLIFDNADVGQLPWPAFDASFYAYRNASDLGGINIYAGELGPQVPAAPSIFGKGDGATGFDFDDGLRAVLATYPGETDAIAGPVAVAFKLSRRHELMVVGTTPRNARIVKILGDLATP